MRLLSALLGAPLAAGCATPPRAGDIGKGIATVATIVPLRMDRPVVGFAPGSGGKRGFAHIGVLMALEAAGIKPDLIVATSADIVIAVNVAYTPAEAALRDPIDMLFQTMQIMAATINRLRLPHADVVIQPDIQAMGQISFQDKRALIALGEQAAREKLPEILRRLGRPEFMRRMSERPDRRH